MATQVTVALSIEALMQLLDRPVMLSKLVRIGSQIVDAVILDAHPLIAQIYGYARPDILRDQYASALHDRAMLGQIRQYCVARRMGLADVPSTYDIRIRMPNGQWRWVRKQQVRQITDGAETYWLSSCVPIAATDARPLPPLPQPIPPELLRRALGWGTVADTTALIRHGGQAPQAEVAPAPRVGIQPSEARETAWKNGTMLAAAVVEGLERATSFELPLGQATYRRWVHRCQRCGQCWVAETAAPKKCIHCKSPYWRTARTRHRRVPPA
jgi:hypothetical protein